MPFYFSTCLVTSFLITGSMGERARLEPLLFFTILIQTLIFPIALSWAWNLEGGFLRNLGYFDRGGSVIIFQVGAIAGVVGSIVLGPRYGKFLLKGEEIKIIAGGQNLERKTLG